MRFSLHPCGGRGFESCRSVNKDGNRGKDGSLARQTGQSAPIQRQPKREMHPRHPPSRVADTGLLAHGLGYLQPSPTFQRLHAKRLPDPPTVAPFELTKTDGLQTQRSAILLPLFASAALAVSALFGLASFVSSLSRIQVPPSPETVSAAAAQAAWRGWP